MRVGKSIIVNILIIGIIGIQYNGIIYAENNHVSDSLDVQSGFNELQTSDPSSLKAQSKNFYKTDSIFSFTSRKGYFPSLVSNLGEQAAAPFKFTAHDWLITGAAAGVTAVLIHFDSDIDEWAKIQKQKHSMIASTSPVITRFGGDYATYTVLATGLISAAINNEKGVQTSLLATQAMFTSGVWVRLIKLFTGRERPMANYNNSKIEGGKWYGTFAMFDQDLAVKKPASSFDSFPSGHTATAFAIATVFATRYDDIKIIPVLCYSTASLVGMSRLIEHEHWSSDVFVGGVLGYLCGKQVVSHFNRTHLNSNNTSLLKPKNKTELNFVQKGNQFGLSLKF